MHAVAGAARFLMEECTPSSRLYEDVSTILTGAAEMSNLITALVDWTGINSSAGDATLTVVDVQDICTSVVRRGSVYICELGRPPHWDTLDARFYPFVNAMHVLGNWACVHMLAACLNTPPSLTVEVMNLFPSTVELDEGRFRHVLAIAMSNAVKARNCVAHSPTSLTTPSQCTVASRHPRRK